jgi:hypothetical protein
VKRRARSAFLAALAAVLALPALSCGDSATGPASGGGLLLVTALTLPQYSGNGVLTVEAAACICVKGPLLVDVNGARVGSMACAGKAEFATPRAEAGATKVEVRVTDASGASGLLSAAATGTAPGAPSFSVRVLCP